MQRFVFDFPNFSKFILRFSVAAIVLLHGIHKLRFGIDFILQWLTSMNLPTYLGYGVYVGEVIAPILIILGLFTRTAAFFLAVNMCVAIFFLANKGLAPFALNSVGGLQAELDFIILGATLAIMCMGSGRVALKES